MKKIIQNFVVASLLAVFASCESEDIIANAKGDAFIVTRVVLEDTVHGIALHVLGNKSISGVSVINEAAQSFQLGSYNGSSYEYYYETNENAFTADLPVVGSYEFTVNFQSGETATAADNLADDIIYPAVITTCEYIEMEPHIQIGWDAMVDADFFVLSMTDESGNMVFISQSLAGTSTTFQIKPGTTGWISNKSPVGGAAYRIELNAFMFEAQKENVNIQAKSIAERSIVWGS